MKTSILSLFIMIALVASGCKAQQKTASPPEPPATVATELKGTKWKLTELMGKPIALKDKTKKEIYLILNKEDNSVHGFSGCNTFMGNYELMEGNRIKFSAMASTMMACPDLDTESEFNKMLGTVDNFSINGNTLTLNKAKMSPLARFEAVKAE